MGLLVTRKCPPLLYLTVLHKVRFVVVRCERLSLRIANTLKLEREDDY